jgi:hypothetical protein
MDAQTMAKALSGSFIGFRGSDTNLLSELFIKDRSLTDVPSNPIAFRFALKALAPELLALGVHVTVFDTGMVRITRASDAQKEASEEARARISFNLPENAAIRTEFGTFERFYAYKRGLAAGRIHEPRRGANVIGDEQPGTSAEVDERLPLEEKCKQRWSLEPATRAEFGNSCERFLAYETAKAKGVVRKFGPAA